MQRTIVMGLRLSEDEAQELTRLAEGMRLTRSDAIRQLVREAYHDQERGEACRPGQNRKRKLSVIHD